MVRLAIVTFLAVLLAGCSSVRLEETTESQTGEAHRGGVVSYRYSKQLATARQIMAAYCSPRGYRIVRVTRASSEESGHVIVHDMDADDTNPVVQRKYAHFECELEQTEQREDRVPAPVR